MISLQEKNNLNFPTGMSCLYNVINVSNLNNFPLQTIYTNWTKTIFWKENKYRYSLPLWLHLLPPLMKEALWQLMYAPFVMLSTKEWPDPIKKSSVTCIYKGINIQQQKSSITLIYS